ncbi:MAG: hypothetical protein U0324_04920 [Polyangiales bacterium]
MNTTRILAGLSLLTLAAAGCYGGPDAGGLDDTGATVEESSGRSWEAFVGAWVGDSGPFHGLVFTPQTQSYGHHFFAYVDNGIRCVRAPCPSEANVEGYFTANTRTVTLRPSPAVTLPTVSFGGYQYTLRGEQLTLSQNGRVVAQLHKAVSYCGEASDCAEQRLIAPRCVGRWTCTAERTCRYVCGRPTAGEGELCGGIAGIPCADGLRCVLQGTYPDAAGVCRGNTCANVRCTATTHCVETATGPQCVANGPSCTTIRCAAGYVCREADGVGGCVAQNRVCGSVLCGEGLVCCNPLRNICTRPGMVCIQ